MPSVALLLKTLAKNAKNTKGKNISRNLTELNDLNAVSGIRPLQKSDYIDDDLYAELIKRNINKYDTPTKTQDIDLEEWADEILEQGGYKPEDLVEYPIRTDEEEAAIEESLQNDLLNILDNRPISQTKEVKEFPVIDKTYLAESPKYKKTVTKLQHIEDPIERNELLSVLESHYGKDTEQGLINKALSEYSEFREPMKRTHKPKLYANAKRTNMDQPNINDEAVGYFDETTFNPSEIPVGTNLNPQEIGAIESTLQRPNVTDRYDREYLRHLVKLLRGSGDFNF